MVEMLINVSLIQYHNLEKTRQKRFDTFVNSFGAFFNTVNLVDQKNPLIHKLCDKDGILVITSDSGFMGGLNIKVANCALSLGSSDATYFISGEKGLQPFLKKNHEMMSTVALVLRSEKGIDPYDNKEKDMEIAEVNYDQVVSIAKAIIGKVKRGEIGSLQVVYPKSITFTQVAVEHTHVLPCGGIFNGETPVDFKRPQGLISDFRKVIVESSYEDIVDYLSETWLVYKLMEIFEDSKLAEFSARAIHLSGSKDYLKKEFVKMDKLSKDMIGERIDKQLREINSAKNQAKRLKQRRKKKDKERKEAEKAGGQHEV